MTTMRLLLLLLSVRAALGVHDARCNKIKDIYTDGRDLLETMWDGAFVYETDEAKAYTMWWTEGGSAGVADAYENPNNLATLALGGVVPNQCMNSGFAHKIGPPTAESADFAECHPWHASSCCHQATVASPDIINLAFGPGYGWDRCGPLSPACERFFVKEACLYQCDVNVALYRKYTDAQHFACSHEGVGDGQAVTLSDGTAYTCIVSKWGGNDENKWQINAMPIKASYADAWYRACAGDYITGGAGSGCDGSLYSCGVFESPPPPLSPPLSPPHAHNEDAELGAGDISAIVLGAVLSILCLVACVLRLRVYDFERVR